MTVKKSLEKFNPPLTKVLRVAKVAERVGVAEITVRRVLKNHPDISEGTARKVVEGMIEELVCMRERQGAVILLLEKILTGSSLAMSH